MRYNKEQQRQWYLRNAAKKKLYARQYYAANRTKCIAAALEYRKRNPGRTVASHRKRMYGMSSADVDKMIQQQDNKCAICRRQFDPKVRALTPHIDHDHRTNGVRGLLCLRCNASLGHLERPGFLTAAQAYLGIKK